jgi:cell fate regulator YaaT (PSP1 superfamily)
LVDKKEIKKLYTIYLNYCRNNQWDVEFISNYLKKSEDKFQNYYNEYNQEEFEEMIKESAIFKKRWGQI